MENSQRIIIEKEGSNGMATAALVLGIVGVVIGIIPFFGWFVFPLWILAIIFGVIGMQNPVNKGLAITGLVLGSATVLYKFGFWLVLIIFSMATEY